MTRQEIDRLLALYSSGALSADEHRRLMEAALQDQSLFEEVMAEDELRAALADAEVAAEVASWPEPRSGERKLGWFRRWGVPAGAVALTAAMGIVLLRPAWKASAPSSQVAKLVQQETSPNAPPGPTAPASPGPMTGSAAPSDSEAASNQFSTAQPKRREAAKLPEAARPAQDAATLSARSVAGAPDASDGHAASAIDPKVQRADGTRDALASGTGVSPVAPPPPPPPPPEAAPTPGTVPPAQSRPVERPRAVFATPPPIPLPAPVNDNRAEDATVRASQSPAAPQPALAERKEGSDRVQLKMEAARMNSTVPVIPDPGATAGPSNANARSFGFQRADALGVFESLHLERRTESGAWTLVAPSAAVDQGTPLRLVVTPRQTGILRIEAGVWKDNQGHSVPLVPQATYRLEATRARGIELNPLEPGTYLVNLKFTPLRLSPGVPARRDPNAPPEPALRFTVK